MKRFSMALVAPAALLCLAFASAGKAAAACECSKAAAETQPKPAAKRKDRRSQVPVVTGRTTILLHEISVQAPVAAPSLTLLGSGHCVSAIANGPLSSSTIAWTDWNCVRLQNSTALWNAGFHDAAIQLMCEDKAVRAAMERAGTNCRAAPARSVAPTNDSSTEGRVAGADPTWP
jgi:hypothetical protein